MLRDQFLRRSRPLLWRRGRAHVFPQKSPHPPPPPPSTCTHMCTKLSKNQLVVLVVLSRGLQPACSWKQVWSLRCPLLSWAGLRPVFTFKQDLCASWLLAQWNPLQTEVWAFHLLLLLHFKWTLIGTFDMNSIEFTMRLQITKIGFHRWPKKSSDWFFENDVRFCKLFEN